jgi:hypothetical protein
MVGKGTVRGILIEGGDGHEYLLGFAPGEASPTPVLSRRGPDGRFAPLADLMEASRIARRELGVSEPHVVGPGWGRHLFLWAAVKEALKRFPPVPAWPTWRG